MANKKENLIHKIEATSNLFLHRENIRHIEVDPKLLVHDFNYVDMPMKEWETG